MTSIYRKKPSTRVDSFAVQQTQGLNDGKVPETFVKYDIDWPVLKDWLQKTFPKHTFDEYEIKGDYYCFRIPEALTEDQRMDILMHRIGEPNDQTRTGDEQAGASAT